MWSHYDDVTMSLMASQITSLTIVYSTVYSGADQRKHQSSASLALVWGIHRGPVNSRHKWPVTRKMFPFDEVIMDYSSSLRLKLNEIDKRGHWPFMWSHPWEYWVSQRFSNIRILILRIACLKKSRWPAKLEALHDDVITQQLFPRYWPGDRRTHLKAGQSCLALVFSS